MPLIIRCPTRGVTVNGFPDLRRAGCIDQTFSFVKIQAIIVKGKPAKFQQTPDLGFGVLYEFFIADAVD